MTPPAALLGLIILSVLSGRSVLLAPLDPTVVAGSRFGGAGNSLSGGIWSTAVLGGITLGVIGGSFTLAGCGLLMGVGLGPLAQRLIKQRRDGQRFRSALPQFIEEFARGLRGGLSPSQALIDGAHATSSPFPDAFRPAATLLAAGASPGDAVGAWADKRNDGSIRFLATAIAVGSVVGGIDGRAADAVAVALQERNTTEAVVRVQATQALYSAGVLCCAPLLFCVMVVLTDQRSSTFLLRHPVGRVVGLTGVALDALGALWMRRMVRQVVR